MRSMRSMPRGCIRFLLAAGHERYTPFASVREPLELLTSRQCHPRPGATLPCQVPLDFCPRRQPWPRCPRRCSIFPIHAGDEFDWRRDLHFQTRTTIDTLDYSGEGLNKGSKVVIAAAGPKRRTLITELPAGLRLPERFQRAPCLSPRSACHPGTTLHSLPGVCRYGFGNVLQLLLQRRSDFRIPAAYNCR
jgi:4-hydroxy-3-polyprenylbenzoate decarboxylase